MNARTREALAKWGREGGRIGGKVATGAIKAAAGRKGVAARVARLAALRASHATLLAIAREVGSYLDGQTTLVGENEQQRLDLLDRLYSAVQQGREIT